MKHHPKLSAIALALALGSAASYSLAQGYSDTYSEPPGSATDTQESQDRLMEPAPPSVIEDSGLQDQPSSAGPQGPVRSETMAEGMNSDAFRSPTRARDRQHFDQSYSAADRGYAGFLQFQERGTNSP